MTTQKKKEENLSIKSKSGYLLPQWLFAQGKNKFLPSKNKKCMLLKVVRAKVQVLFKTIKIKYNMKTTANKWTKWFGTRCKVHQYDLQDLKENMSLRPSLTALMLYGLLYGFNAFQKQNSHETTSISPISHHKVAHVVRHWEWAHGPKNRPVDWSRHFKS